MNKRVKDPLLFVSELKKGEVPNIVKLIKTCGVDVYTYNSDKFICNALLKKKNNKYSIIVDSNLEVSFQRFLLSYLLSYAYLYQDSINIYSVFNETIYDRAAYNYALDILMPDKVFRYDMLKDLDAKYVQFYAQYYKISENIILEKLIKYENKNKFKVLKLKEERK